MSDSYLISERALARTYNSRAYADTYGAVEDYRCVCEYHLRNPDTGSSAIASRFDLPRGRVRPWLDGSKPDPVRGIDTARDYGWLQANYDDPEFVALNALVANVFSGGSIAESNYVPSFALNYQGEESHVIDALEGTGIEYTFAHEDTDDRATEVRPTKDGTVLGRVLAVLGAPVGPKAEISDLSLPKYLKDAPHDIREQFVLAYLANRALHQPDKRTVQIQEKRPKSYRDELAELIEAVAGETVTSGERMVTISADAARSLGIRPRVSD